MGADSQGHRNTHLNEESVVTEDQRQWKGRRGSPALTGKRDEYRRLISQGMSNSEACRRVGVNRRTGSRWRYGRVAGQGDGHEIYYPPVVAAVVISGRFLSQDERLAIGDGVRAGRSLRSIADELGRSPSTVSREIARNSDPATGEYRPWTAQRRAEARRARPKARRLQADAVLRAVVQAGFDQRWSPEQIANTLTVDHPDQPQMRLCPESIYREIYAPDSVVDRKRPVLRTGRLHRQRRRGQRRERFCAPMVMISERPAEVDARVTPGHWEGDLIVGARNQSAIATLVERTTLYTILIQLGRHRSADQLRDELIRVFTQLPDELARSLTWDQGMEMARHHEFATVTGIPVYFCEPASPWQRPINENTNGLLRQYFPKGTDLSTHTDRDVQAAAAQLNRRPRKTLAWRSPAAIMDDLLYTPPVATIL